MIEFIDEESAISTDEKASFTFEVIDKRRNTTQPWSPLDVFTNRGYVSRFQDWNIFPYGENNNLPLSIRNIVYANSIVPGILNKKTGLNWGKGPKLYEETFDEKGNLVRKWQKDATIEKWLKSWNSDKFLLKGAVDFSHIESYYAKFIFKKGWRLGDAPFIYKLEHIQSYRPMVVGKRQTPTHILMEKKDDPNQYEVYPLQYSDADLVKASQSVMYTNLPSFCSDFFSIPQILGSIPWIVQSTNVPKFLEALSKNSINIKYHITSPQEFWNQKRDELKDQCADKNIPYDEKMLKALKRKMLRDIQKVLSTIENAGKFWHSEQVMFVEGVNIIEMGWKITPIDTKMGDIVKAHIDIANKADQSASTGVGIGGSLGNTGDKGKANGGSEQYYALNNYLQTGIDIPEMVIMDPINFAIKTNWPDSNLKLGFYHTEPQRQEDMTSGDRNKVADFKAS